MIFSSIFIDNVFSALIIQWNKRYSLRNWASSSFFIWSISKLWFFHILSFLDGKYWGSAVKTLKALCRAISSEVLQRKGSTNVTIYLIVLNVLIMQCSAVLHNFWHKRDIEICELKMRRIRVLLSSLCNLKVWFRFSVNWITYPL